MEKIRTGNKKVFYDEEEAFESDSIIELHEEIERSRIFKENKRRTEKEDDSEDDDDEEYNIITDSDIDCLDEEIEDEKNLDGKDIIKDNIKTGKKRKAEKIPKLKKEKVFKEKKEKIKPQKKEKPPKLLLDPQFILEDKYFYQDLSEKQLDEIEAFISNYLGKSKNDLNELQNFFGNYSVLKKGDHNIQKLTRIIDNQVTKFSQNQDILISYKLLIDFIIKEYYSVKPAILECHFFPNVKNEVKIVNMLRTSKKTIDIAIFTLTNDKIFAGIEEAFNRGVKVRIIADDECCKMLGSDIIRCAALGIPTRTDSDVRAHMHHKFCVIDNAVLVTGSFNWTVQAVKQNQENILFYENRELAIQYTQEFSRLWNLFTHVVSKEESQKRILEDQEKKKVIKEQKDREKLQKKREKEELKKK